MIIYYQKIADSQNFWAKRYVCEELLRIFLGNYGTVPDIEKAIRYGETAMSRRSAYAAFRIGEYYAKQTSEEYEKIIYYLECALDYQGCVEDASKLLKKYLKEHEIPQYFDTEASLLMEAGSFYNLGRMYHTGRVIERSTKTALYFYTRSMKGLVVTKEKYSANYYNLAYYFMSDLQKEGISIPEATWKEIESNRSKEKFHNRFDQNVAEVLAELNIRFHIIDMQAFQKQIQDVVLVFDIPNDRLCNLQSDFFGRGMMDRKDQKYL